MPGSRHLEQSPPSLHRLSGVLPPFPLPMDVRHSLTYVTPDRRLPARMRLLHLGPYHPISNNCSQSSAPAALAA